MLMTATAVAEWERVLRTRSDGLFAPRWPYWKRDALIKLLEAREARILELEAKHGLGTNDAHSSEPDSANQLRLSAEDNVRRNKPKTTSNLTTEAQVRPCCSFASCGA